LILSFQKKFIYLFFTIYFLTGSYLSLTNGISHDEFHEQQNWIINIESAKDFFLTGSYDALLNYGDKYHGIAFQIISQPIQYLIKDLVISYNKVSEFGGLLISKHFVVFLFFTTSGFFFFLIMNKITKDFFASVLSTALYLTYPYLLGHALFNPKDIPFLSVWIICTYFSLSLVEDFYFNKKIKISQLMILAFFTAFLTGIRIVGFLILIQYLVSILIFLQITKKNLLSFLKKNYFYLLISLISFVFFVYILSPIFWHNPLEILNSIKWMGKYPQNICTLTNGSCLYSLSLPSSYYFVWLFYKLPLLILIGCFIFPLVESKIFKNDLVSIYYGTLIIIVPVIIIIFILKNVAIYDELRHVLFIFPLILIISLSNLYIFFKKHLFNLFTILLLFFFIMENISLNPYQYTWLNSLSKFKDIEKNFEIDYWGISNKNLQKKIIEFSDKEKISKSICIYGDNYVREFLIFNNFKCFGQYGEIDDGKTRPFIAYKNLRNVKRSDPKNCQLIWNEGYSYTFHKKKISTGTLWYCD